MTRRLLCGLAGGLFLLLAIVGCSDSSSVAGPTATPKLPVITIPSEPIEQVETATMSSAELPTHLESGVAKAIEQVIDTREVSPDVESELVQPLDYEDNGSVIQRSILIGIEPHQGSATPSVDMRILDSDVVVRVTYVSETSDSLTFRTVEYLKGSGPSTVTITASTVGRPMTWDNREAILFLKRTAAQATKSVSGEFAFTESTPDHYQGELPVGFALGSRTAAWLPAASSESAGGAGRASGIRSYLADAATPLGDLNPEVSLDEIRNAIEWQQSGSDIEKYDECVRRAVHYEQWHRDYQAYHGKPWTTWEVAAEIASGVVAEAIEEYFRQHGGTLYDKSWVSGPDAAYFEGRAVGDDDLPETGYYDSVLTTRPLPAGAYKVTTHNQKRWYQPCNYIPADNKLNYTVTVTPPPNTLHEAFFDPVTLASGVGADSSNGVIKPAGFTVDGTSTSITGLKWENGSVVLTLSPYVSLTGHKVEFIELDGLVGLSLDVDDAAVDSGAGTLTWGVSGQPWEAGDLLMLRIVGAESSAKVE